MQDQLASADIFLLTKTDIATKAQIAEARTTLSHHQPHVPIITLLSDDADLAQLLVPDDDTDSQSHHVHPDHHTRDHMQDFNSIAGVGKAGQPGQLAFSRICKQFSHLILRGKRQHYQRSRALQIWHQTGRHINFTPHPDSHDRPDDKDSRLIIIAIEQLDAVSDALHQLGFTSHHDSSANPSTDDRQPDGWHSRKKTGTEMTGLLG